MGKIHSEATRIGAEEAEAAARERSGPFRLDLRVACPAKRFARRRLAHCVGCEHFGGLFRFASEGVDDRDPEMAVRLHAIQCEHPIRRRLEYFPED